ncbi:MAG: hypothetical protein WDN03_14615 [Rhizomicrobium sp.]
MKGRQRSTAYFIDSGGGSPVSFSRTIRPSTSADRGIGAYPRLGQAALGQPLFQSRRQVVRHTLHRQRSDRLDARLLGGFEHGGGIGRLRTVLVVHLVLVMRLAQGVSVAGTAHDRHFMRRQVARRQRKLRDGSGSRALRPRRAGGSAENVTSSSGSPDSARTAPVTARLNGSEGFSGFDTTR